MYFFEFAIQKFGNSKLWASSLGSNAFLSKVLLNIHSLQVLPLQFYNKMFEASLPSHILWTLCLFGCKYSFERPSRRAALIVNLNACIPLPFPWRTVKHFVFFGNRTLAAETVAHFPLHFLLPKTKQNAIRNTKEQLDVRCRWLSG